MTAATAQAEAVEFLRNVIETPEDEAASLYPGTNGNTRVFLRDLLNKQLKYGELTERQVDAVLKIRDRSREWRHDRAERAANAQPFRAGRRTIQGVIISTREQDTGYGPTLKCLIDEGDGNRVWGTVPAQLRELTEITRFYNEAGEYVEQPPRCPDLKGQTVRLTATVQQSDDDPHFGFYSRPTDGELTDV